MKCLQKLGRTTTEVWVVDLDEAKERAALLTLNNSAGEWDGEGLAGLLKELQADGGDLDLTGFTEDSLADLKIDLGNGAEPMDAEPQIDKAEELRKKWKVELGQIWELGDHRLMCGDSTNRENVYALVNGQTVGLSLTDPPYSVNYSISFSKAEGKRNPGIQKEYKESNDPEGLLGGFLFNVPCGLLVMTFPVDRHFFTLADQLRSAGFCHVRELVWVKSSASFHPGQTYQQKHEPILICGRNGQKYPQTVPSDANTVLIHERTSGHEDHPTEKPLGLWKVLLSWHSETSDAVYDPFSGSGTTIMASENLQKTCLAMELSPAFVAVAIQRWADATGKTPRLING